MSLSKDLLNSTKKGYNSIEEKALMFAVMAHQGRTRKGETNKPEVLHPIAAAQILRDYLEDKGQEDEDAVAALYLHDVVENTKYSLEDIRNNFGDNIASLVEIATEPEKNASWEERKLYTIEHIKDRPLREKLFVISDKINNIEDTCKRIQRKGFKDFSCFKRGEEQQEWYYRNLYKSFIQNEDKDNELFERFEKAIDQAFGRTMEEYFEKQKDEDVAEL